MFNSADLFKDLQKETLWLRNLFIHAEGML